MNSSYLKVLKFQNTPDSTVICGFFGSRSVLEKLQFLNYFGFQL